jgi:hypothetical protein
VTNTNKGLLVFKSLDTNNLTAIFELILGKNGSLNVSKTLWASMAYYSDSFTFLLITKR